MEGVKKGLALVLSFFSPCGLMLSSSRISIVSSATKCNSLLIVDELSQRRSSRHEVAWSDADEVDITLWKSSELSASACCASSWRGDSLGLFTLRAPPEDRASRFLPVKLVVCSDCLIVVGDGDEGAMDGSVTALLTSFVAPLTLSDTHSDLSRNEFEGLLYFVATDDSEASRLWLGVEIKAACVADSSDCACCLNFG